MPKTVFFVHISYVVFVTAASFETLGKGSEIDLTLTFINKCKLPVNKMIKSLKALPKMQNFGSIKNLIFLEAF